MGRLHPRRVRRIIRDDDARSAARRWSRAMRWCAAERIRAFRAWRVPHRRWRRTRLSRAVPGAQGSAHHRESVRTGRR